MPPLASLHPLVLTLPFSLLGLSTTVATMSLNGFGRTIRLLRAGTHTSLPGAPAPFRTHYTGVGAVDVPLQFTTAFFVALVNHDGDGDDDGKVPPEWVLAYVWAMAQFALGFGVMVIEARRWGRRRAPKDGSKTGCCWWDPITWAGTWGMAFQGMAFTTVLPVWVGVHHMTTATKDIISLDDVALGHSDAIAIPLVLGAAFVVPAVVMSMPEYFATSVSTHYLWHAIWQVFPLVTILLLTLIRFLFPSSSHKPTPAQHLSRSRWTYGALLAAAATIHLPILALSLLPALSRASLAHDSLLPASISKIIARATFRNIFLPNLPWHYSPTVDAFNPTSAPLVGAALDFLRYDALIPSVPLLAWAVLAYGRARTGVRDGVETVVLKRAAWWLVLGGPYAAVVWLLWERDAVVCAEIDERTRKEKSKKGQ
jgi:hypothetical protein